MTENLRKTYVLDTSVLLAAGPRALRVFDEHEVVVPLAAIHQLEAKRDDPELGWIARRVLRALEDLRLDGIDRGAPLSDGVAVNDSGGTVRVELNHSTSFEELPASLRRSRTEAMRIVAVAKALEADGANVVLVSRDVTMRLVAGGALGMEAQDYRNDQAPEDGYTGVETVHTDPAAVDELYASGTLDDGSGLAVNTGLVLKNGSASAVGVVRRSGQVGLLDPGQMSAFDVKPRSVEQRIALHHLLNPDVGIVSLGGPAGTGKSLLALAAGLEQTLNQRRYNKIVVFRPLYAVGGQDLGYLPGTAEEKMEPWAQAVFDALESFCSKNVLDEVRSRGLIEVQPVTFLRGRTLSNTFVIVDEAQSLERSVLLTALSRTGEGSKVVLAHDVAQRDNRFVGRHDGIATVVEKLTGDPLFAHTTLRKTERSAVAELATRLLDDGL